jgi:hypothetical protein
MDIHGSSSGVSSKHTLECGPDFIGGGTFDNIGKNIF